MARYILCSLMLTFCWMISSAQKTVVTLDTYKSWSYAGNGDISSNGKYVLYIETVLPERKTTLFVKSTSGKLVFTRAGVKQAKFSSDCKHVVMLIAGDTLSVFHLANRHHNDVAKIPSFDLKQWANKERIYARSNNGDLQILDYQTKGVYQLAAVRDYKVISNGRAIAVVLKDRENNGENLLWVDAATGRTKTVYSGNAMSGLIVDRTGKQIAFLPAGVGNNIGYYRIGMSTAELIEIKSELSFDPGSHWSFNDDGSLIFFSLVGREPEKNREGILSLDIWNYRDTYLKSYYMGRSDIATNVEAPSYLAALSIATRKTKQLTKGDQVMINGSLDGGLDDFFIAESDAVIRSGKWTNGVGRNYFLCAVKTGEMILLKENATVPQYRWYKSPTGKYVVYYDYERKGYICYDIATKVKRNISEGIKGGLLNYQKLHYPNPQYYSLGVAGWLKNDRKVLIQGTYDLWVVDPLGTEKPINLTREVGEVNKIVFCPATRQDEVVSNGDLLVTAFDTKSKEYGFYTVNINGAIDPIKLSMQPYYLEDVYVPLRTHKLRGGKSGYLVHMEQSNSAPNYFFSKDLKSFRAVSDVQPQRNWNWLKAELHSYKDSLGNGLQGLLYKPENFDPSIKYPVIFGVYELQSNHLHSFLRPDLAGAMFSIPWLVSNGYLVFLPDIKGQPRYGGDGLTRCIVAAADHLAQYSFIDTSKMAIAGHSIGGFVTNYAVTHCNRFKAAIAGAGVSNMLTAATDLWGGGASKQEFLKDAVYMMDVNLLDDIPAYVRNSPLLSAKNLNTPLLLIHNDNDGSVRYEQTRSFFIVLRELGKPCWWLNYKGKDHHVSGEREKIDYNFKVKEFFDHYLKGAAMPAWMKEHI